MSLGILYALGSLIFRWVGDFMIQKSTRKVGNLTSLFCIVFVSLCIVSVLLYSRWWIDIGTLIENRSILIGIWLFSTASALINFNALRIGKLSVIQPLITIEIPTAAIVAYFILQQTLNIEQIIALVILILWLMLLSYKKGEKDKKYNREKWIGRWLATGLALWIVNFLVGYGSITIDPVTTIRAIDIIICLIVWSIIIYKRQCIQTIQDAKKNCKLLIITGVFDSLWWLSFAHGALLVPISIMAGISEWYVAFSSILWISINKESLQKQQVIGLIITVLAAISLAVIT